jgi:hypothetical protein
MDSHDDHNTPDTHANGDSGYEKQDVNVIKLLAVTAGAVVFVVVVIIVLLQFFVAESEQQIYRAVLAPESAALRDLRAREDQALNSYGVIDTTKGVYRIPIDRAMKLEADEAFLERTAGEGNR